MFLRLIRSQGSTDRAQQDAAQKIYLDQFVPRIKQQPGYAGFFLAVDRASGTAASVTYWHDEASAAASAPTPELIQQAEAAMNAKIGEVVTFETVLLERTKPPMAGIFMRTNDYAADPARVEAGVAFARDRAYPALKGQPGFRSLSVSTEPKTGRTVVGTTWDSLQDLQRSEAAVVDLRAELGNVMGATGVKTEIWEIAAIEVMAEASLPS